MTQEEIISMAREAGFEDFDRWCEHYPQETKRWCERMERFAKLVEEKEREACAKLCENIETYEKIEKACFKFAAKTIRARGQQ